MARSINNKQPKSNKAKRKLMAEARGKRDENPSPGYFETLRARQERDSEAAQIRLADSRKLTRNVPDAIQKIFDGSIAEVSGVPHQHRLRGVFSLYQKVTPIERPTALRLLLALEAKKIDWFTSNKGVQNVSALVSLIKRETSWINSPDDWVCKTKNKHRQFASFLRFLLAKYDVPLFMDEAWLHVASPNDSAIYQNWWVHIAHGKNIRKAENLPFPLTKKMAHHFLQAPKDFSVFGALRWGHVFALDGDERTVRGVMTTTLRTSDLERTSERHDFWTSVIRFFIANPMLDVIHYGPIVDYLNNQKYVTPRGADAPPQPQLCMKNREAAALLAQVESWHNLLGLNRGKGRKKNLVSWDHQTIPDFSWEEQKKDHVVEYAIVELLNSAELETEGRRLSHCVSSYSWSCSNGSKSIWSIRLLQGGGTWEPLGTIELMNRERSVVQFRAKRNSIPGIKAWSLLDRWAKKSGVSVSRWVGGTRP